MLHLVDSHVHLDDSRFDVDRQAVIDRAVDAGIAMQIVPAVDRASWGRIQHLCSGREGLFPAYGLHPMFLDQHDPSHLDELLPWIEKHRPVAVGEIGLDFYVEGLDADRQRVYFRRQLEIARDVDLPVIVHARKAFEEVTLTLRRMGGLRGVVHSFSGSEEQAEQLWKLGFYLGIGGPVTYERAHRLRNIVAKMPLEFLLLESDAPDQPDATHSGKRNEPAYVGEVLRCIAQLRQMDPDTLAAATTENACRLFGLSSLSSLRNGSARRGAAC